MTIRLYMMLLTNVYDFILWQKEDINQELVPRVGMVFKTVQDAKDFFVKYGQEVGFGVKLYRSYKDYKWINCNKEGSCTFHKKGEDRKRNKTTKRVSCKCGMKMKMIRDEEGNVSSYVVVYVKLHHNHTFLPSPSATAQFHCNKRRDSPMVEFIGAMQDSRIPNHCILDMMADMHGGPENIPMTHKDIANM